MVLWAYSLNTTNSSCIILPSREDERIGSISPTEAPILDPISGLPRYTGYPDHPDIPILPQSGLDSGRARDRISR